MIERKRMELYELRLTPEFLKLTPKQQLFIETYCAPDAEGNRNYDAVFAVQTAYKTKSPEVARIMSYAMLQNMRIVAVLNRHFNRTPTEEFLINLERAVHNKHITTAQVQLLRMQCDMLGYDSALPAVGNSLAHVPKAAKAAAKSERKAKERAEKAPKVEEPYKPFF